MGTENNGSSQGAASKLAAAPSIDLPKGGGALRGIDEKFQSSPATGSASFSIPLPLSPSRGFEPEISLSYDSGSGNGPFGLGWSLSVPNICRKTDKGLPEYFDSSDSDVFIMSGAEDLVPCGEKTDGDWTVRLYRPRIESGFARIERRKNKSGIIHWRTVSADNVTRIYGETAEACIADPANEKHIFQWLLEFSHDGKGNAVSYRYESDGSNRYLKNVFYGNEDHYSGVEPPAKYFFNLSFEYGERPDSFSTYRSCFEIRFRRRCEKVLMHHNFENAILVRSLNFEYSHSDSDISLLSKATQTGYIGDSQKSLPAMSFSYQACEWNDDVRFVDSDSLDGLPAGLASPGSHFIDLYGEGLSGVLTEASGGWRYKRNEGNGRLGPSTALRDHPFTGSAANIQELEGDSEKYLVEYSGSAQGFYRFDDGRAWAPMQAMRAMPTVGLNSPHARTLDLDGDGRADLLVDEGNAFLYYRSEGKKGFELESRFLKPFDEDKGPAVVFADLEQSVFLADMSGDGLTDIVRVRNGNVCYWPNLGHGKFGEKVYMSGSPRMDMADMFNAGNVRLADVDGSGTADLIYIDGNAISIWLNKSGDGFSEKKEINLFSDNKTQIAAMDFLGNGTACIVWSSPLASHSSRPLRYVDLMNGKKPYLMTGYDNGMGKTVELEYTPSTKFYLEDRENGKPWVTKLPFPVHCLSKVVTHDHVSGHTFASAYSYHHGYYDIPEREFRGFGRVDQVDAEDFGGELDQPPVLKKTWLHLGAYAKSEGLLSHYESEYNPVYEKESRLGQPALGDGSYEEQREAMRSLKGMPLREEVYALDGTELENVPYTTTQFSYHIEQLQAKGGNRHACYIAVQSESLMHHYERNASDPRVAHSLALKFDKYMRPEVSAEAVYGRKTEFDEQKKRHVIVTETRYADDINEKTAFRMGLECSAKTWELAPAGAPFGVFTREQLLDEFANAESVPFEEEVAKGQKRLVEHAETLFYNDGLSGPLALGKMARHGLPYENYSLAYTASLIAHLYGDGRIENSMLIEGGFIQRESEWLMRTGQNIYAPEAVSNFYLPNGFENAFGEKTSIAYDKCNLLMESLTDPLKNTVTAVNDYRTLSPSMITDPNGNKTAVETDALGIVVKTAAMGKNGEGDTLDEPTAKMEYGFAEFDNEGKILKPSWVKTSSRETHKDRNTRWLETVEYSDGMGRVALVKTKAEPRDGEQRWVGTGRTVFNNKGNPLKQYEPYFSDTEAWESEPEMREQGVTPVMHYDPLDRLVKTEFPDKTFSKVEFTAWEQWDYDRCDTAESSPHCNTPAVTHLDSLGRAFYVVKDDGKGSKPATKTVLDIEGNESRIIDARGNAVMEYRYGIHGEKGYTKSMDAGERWMLLAADGQPIYTWDSRGHKLHFEYDELRRPIKQWLNDDTLVGMTVYGKSAENNLIGQAWKIYDQSGMIENTKFDFKGNLLESKRKFTVEYKETINWNVNDPNALLLEEEFISTTEYDALNRAINLCTPHNNSIPSSEIMPKYDEGGLLKEVKAKLRGADEETNFVTGISYNPKGQGERIKYGNGATTRYDYDEKTFRLTRLLTTRSNGTDALQDLNYKYDQMGNITEIKDDAQQTIFFSGQVVNPNQKFEYDALYRLTKATGREHTDNVSDIETKFEEHARIYAPVPSDAAALRNYARQWEYDQVGNILEMIHQANNGSWSRSYNYSANDNRLLSTEVGSNAVNYAYNEHGSMISMPHLQAMDWDFAERLCHITRGSTEAYYNYDGSGQRTRKVVEKGNTVEERLYLGGFEIWRKKVNGNIDTERETLHIMDDVKRIAITETKTIDNGIKAANPIPAQRYQLSNNIESATLELDENADIISYEEYYPYGDTSYQAGKNESEVSQKRYRYTGKEKDEESGLYYHGARYYACWLGRWTAADPAGLVDGLNLYMYCGGNPIKANDPSGTQKEEDYVRFIVTENVPNAAILREQIRREQGFDIKGGITTERGKNGYLEFRIKKIDYLDAVARKIEEDYAEHNRNNGTPPMSTRDPNTSFFMQKSFPTIDQAGIAGVNMANKRSMKDDIEYGGLIYRKRSDNEFYITSLYKGGEGEITLPNILFNGIDYESEIDYELVGVYHSHGNSNKKEDQTFSFYDIEEAEEFSKIIRAPFVSYLGTNAKSFMSYKIQTIINKFSEFIGYSGTNAEDAKKHKILGGVQKYHNQGSITLEEINNYNNNYYGLIKILIERGVLTSVE